MYFLPVKIVSQYQPDMINLSYTVTKTDFLISGGLVLTQQVCFIFKMFLASKKFNISQGENIAKPVKVILL